MFINLICFIYSVHTFITVYLPDFCFVLARLRPFNFAFRHIFLNSMRDTLDKKFGPSYVIFLTKNVFFYAHSCLNAFSFTLIA